MESKSHPSERQQAGSLLRLLGWGGFWIQFVLTIVAGLILSFAILDPTLNLRLKSGIGLLSVIGGIVALGLSTIPVNEIDLNPETLTVQGIQVLGSRGNYQPTPPPTCDRFARLIARLQTMAGNIALFSHNPFGSVLAVRWIGLA